MSVIPILRAPGLRISVCPNPSRKGGKIYGGWQVRESVRGSSIIRRTFSAAATGKDRKDAKDVALKFARDRAKVLIGQATLLPREDLLRFRAALVNLYGTGVNVEQATAEYALAKRELAGLPASLVDAARFYRAHHRGDCQKTVAQVVEELLDRRRKENASAVHVRDLENRLTRFAGDLQCPINALNAPVIQTWIDGLKDLSNRTLKNYLAAISNLVGFAKTKSYLPADWSELDRLDRIKVGSQPIEIFTPTEMLHLLQHAKDTVLPVLVLGGFAGLRPSETLQMTWERIDWQQNSLIADGKTGPRRVPMEPNLRAWLEPLRGAGPIVTISEAAISNQFTRTVTRANKALARERINLNLAWKHNAPRHSCVSYWSRIHKNPYEVSSWTGHSAATMKKYYCNQTVTDEAARAWFAIMPETKAVQLSLFTGLQTTAGAPESCPEFVRKEAS
jgi:integrase